MNKYYTYAYLDPRINVRLVVNDSIFDYEPFYIGKGTGNRFNTHKQRWSYLKKNSHKNNKIKQIINDGFVPIVYIIKSGITEEEALYLESHFIKEIGTRCNISGIKAGPLTNLKIDGVIQKYSNESKRKMSQSAKLRKRKPHTEETKRKIKESNKSKTIEVRTKLSIALKGKPKPIGHSIRMSILHKGKTISTGIRKQISDSLKGRTFSKESKRKMTESQLCHWKILIEHTEEILTVTDLKTWCNDNNINYSTFYSTLSRNKFHKGYKLQEKIYSPR